MSARQPGRPSVGPGILYSEQADRSGVPRTPRAQLRPSQVIVHTRTVIATFSHRGDSGCPASWRLANNPGMFDEFGVAVASSDAAGRKLRRLAARGTAVRMFPRVYVQASAAALPLTRIRALQAWCPDGVLVGAAAACLGYWPDCPLARLEIASLRRGHAPACIRLHQRRVPPEWVVDHGPFRYTHPAFTAAYLAGSSLAGTAVDEALRSGVALSDIMSAPLTGWPGALQRRHVLRDSRSEPWSELERRGHRLLHAAHVGGWRANVAVSAGGVTWFCDVVFRHAKLIIEFDSLAFHSTPQAFERDRRKHNALAAAGWQVLHVTWRQLEENPEGFTELVRQLLAARRARLTFEGGGS